MDSRDAKDYNSHMPIIKNWNISHKDHHCFHIEELCLEKGLSYHLSGKNGTGKTTFLKMLCGLEEETLFAPVDCGYFHFSEFDLLPFLSVSENLAYFYQNLDEQEKSFYEWSKDLTLYEQLKDKKMKDISTGEKQIFKFQLVLSLHKKIICLDEVFSHLDQKYHHLLCQNLEQAKNEKIIITCSQEKNPSADRNLIIESGRLQVLEKEELR